MRIAGTVAFDRRPGDLVLPLLEDLRAKCLRPAAVTVERGAQFSFGAVGEDPKVFTFDGVSLCFDGTLLGDGESSADDARTVVESYRRYGFPAALEQLEGDFAIALFDTHREVLWLGRDHIGVRPLYYTGSGDLWAFASQPGALRFLPGISTSVRRDFLAVIASCHYRYFDNRQELSPYEGIFQVPAGHAVKIERGRAGRERFWSVPDSEEFSLTTDELAGEYSELLVGAVRKRLRRARKPGFSLSGGMDSSSVLATAVQILGAKQDAFSVVYSDDAFDESREIASMLEATVQTWTPVRIDAPDLLNTVTEMVRVHDEPVATATWLSHFLLCREIAARGYNVLFGGLGGDELHAGEYEHFFYFFADLISSGNETRLEEEVSHWAAHHDHPIYRKNMAVMRETLHRTVDLRSPGRCVPDPVRLERYWGALNREFFDIREVEFELDHPFRSYLSNRSYQDLFRETTPCCLRAQDRHGNAFGVEHRSPLLDRRLVEFMFRVPSSQKVQNGVTKQILRAAMKGVLPEETRTRVKKVGWNAPAHRWFADSSLLREIVESRPFAEHGVYNCREVLRLLAEHEEIIRTNDNRENHMMFFWQLFNLELWLRECNPSIR